MAIAARKLNATLPDSTAIEAEVDLNTDDGGYFLSARLNISLPGLDPDVARRIVDVAHQTCPYSKATRGNIEAQINLR
jgi:organic hydroperoxide reductase OsmC/OhrA